MYKYAKYICNLIILEQIIKFRFNILLFLLMFFVLPSLYSQEETRAEFTEELTFEDILINLYRYPEEVKNKNFIEGNWGMGNLFFVTEKIDEKFAPVYPALFKYGFSRINPYVKVDNRFYAAGEFVAVEELTSHLHPKRWRQDGNTVDIWRFIGGYMNGWGYLYHQKHLLLNHASYLGWAHSDIELPSLNPDNQKEFNKYDGKYKFTNGFEASIEMETAKNLYIRMAYNRSVIFPSFNLFEWMPGVLLELITQRTVDAFAEQLLKPYPDIFPVANFIVKNGISYLLYSLRKKNMFWPVQSHYPMNIYNFSIGIKFVF